MKLKFGCQGGGAYIPVEAHDDEREHKLVHDAGAQEVEVHYVSPHAVLHAAPHSQCTLNKYSSCMGTGNISVYCIQM